MAEQDQNSARYILSIIQEEEAQSDEIKKIAKSQRALPAPVVTEEGSVVDPSAASSEQSFNREQVQEQEQEQEQEQVHYDSHGYFIVGNTCIRNKRKRRRRRKRKWMRLKRRSL